MKRLGLGSGSWVTGWKFDPAVAAGLQFRPSLMGNSEEEIRGHSQTDRAAHLTTTTFGSTGDGQLGNAMSQRDEWVHRLKRFECFSTCQRVQVYLGPDIVTECYVEQRSVAI